MPLRPLPQHKMFLSIPSNLVLARPEDEEKLTLNQCEEEKLTLNQCLRTS
jgi:hypothetical protein